MTSPKIIPLHAMLEKLQDAGLTQMDIALRCDCSQATISDLKSQKITDPRMKTFTAICELYREVCES